MTQHEYEKRKSLETEKPRLISKFKYVFPAFLIVLAMWFGIHFDEPVPAAVMIIILLVISYFFIYKPGIKSDL